VRRAGYAGLALAALVAACGGEGAVPDGGTADPDAGARADAASPVDAGEVADAGSPDAAPRDAGPPPLGPVTVDLSSTRPPDDLAAYNLFRVVDGRIEYNDRVVPYTLNTPLFSDYAVKARALYVPEGATIPYAAEGPLDLPVGSVLIKTFLFGDDLRAPQESLRLIETRLLVRYPDEWRAFPYVWSEDQRAAAYFVRGEVRTLSFIDPLGAPRTAQYLIPQKNQCLECHERKDANDDRYTTPIGPQARQLNREEDFGSGPKNQLQHLADLGMLTGLPALESAPKAFEWDALATTGTTSLDAATVAWAARDYLDMNCAHCHRPDATQGMTSRLWLNFDNEDTFHLGFCKEPGSAGSASAGRQYDIVPGDAEASILIYRTETEVVGDMMPLLGRSVADTTAVGILRGWVDGLPPDGCGR
jgi:uncharacterized repeat protein (TIGR03806 family)